MQIKDPYHDERTDVWNCVDDMMQDNALISILSQLYINWLYVRFRDIDARLQPLSERIRARLMHIPYNGHNAVLSVETYGGKYKLVFELHDGLERIVIEEAEPGYVS